MSFDTIWNNAQEKIGLFLGEYGFDFLGAILILVLGWMLAAFFAGRVRKLAEKSGKIDATLIPVLTKMVRLGLLALVIVAALDKVGVDTASLFALVGAAGLAIGLALKDTAADIAAGIALLILRPFNIGEAVEIGSSSGTVEEIGIFQTRLTSFDGVPLVLNNSRVRTSEIKNYSRSATRRIEWTVGIDYGADIDAAMKILLDTVTQEARVLAEPAPVIDVTNLGDSSVDILVRVWCNAPDFFATKLALGRQMKQALDAAGIGIPFPQREIRILKDEAAA
ncbi:MAG: mechanosensitive ion channel domain-containing protein [Myxococcota bacterium]|nr:mechanosensitive ion channel domain-containing protein [Myxococcota bacterium]